MNTLKSATKQPEDVLAVHAEIEASLLDGGTAVARVSELDVMSLNGWRSAARRVARRLERPIRTVVSEDPDVVAAVLMDWPATPEERARSEARTQVQQAWANVGFQPSGGHDIWWVEDGAVPRQDDYKAVRLR